MFTAGLVGQLMLVHTVDILVCTVLTMYVQSMIRRGNSPYAHLPVTILFDYTLYMYIFYPLVLVGSDFVS